MIAFLLIDSFSSPYRLDRDTTISGILLYGTEDMPSNSFAVEMKPTERFCLELIYVTLLKNLLFGEISMYKWRIRQIKFF